MKPKLSDFRSSRDTSKHTHCEECHGVFLLVKRRNSANLLRPMNKLSQKQKFALKVTKWFQGSVVVLVSGHNRELFCDALRDIKTLTAIPTS